MYNKTKYRIPDLQLNVIIIQLDKFSPEFYPNGNLMFLSIPFIRILQQKTGLPDAFALLIKTVPESPMMMYLNKKA